MLSYCLKDGKNVDSENPKFVKTEKGEPCLHQTMQYVTLKDRELSKNTKQKGCYATLVKS